MAQLLPAYPVNFLALPSLAQFAKRCAVPVSQTLVAASAAGLSLADIEDVSRRATAKNGLKVRRESTEV